MTGTDYKLTDWTRADLVETGPRRWALGSEVTYHVGGHPSPLGWTVVVPEGFETDGVTLPGPLRLLTKATWRLRQAALLHDYLLTVEVDRVIAHGVFHEAARATPGCPAWLATAAYVAVTVWGAARSALRL